MIPIFDGHNDVLTKLREAGGVEVAEGFLTGLPGHLDAAKAKAGGFAGGFFAIWPPSDFDLDGGGRETWTPPYDYPKPPPLDPAAALASTREQAAILLRLQELGALTVCTDVDALEAGVAEGRLVAIMHLEGADGIGADLAELDELYALGLRSLGLVWSRDTIFGAGVPFRFPSSPDIGAGLTEAGRRLVRRCNELGVLVDLSHLNEAGFWDVARLSDAPLVATHSNAHAVTPHARNLTDDQLRAIADSGGVAGLNFEVSFLRDDGRVDAATPLDRAMAHLDHMLSILGEDGVAIGSDFDGCLTPDAIGGADGLPALRAAMAAHGFGRDLTEKICWRNWMRVLRATWR